MTVRRWLGWILTAALVVVSRPAAAETTVVVVDTVPVGVDVALASFVTQQLRETAEDIGYAPAPMDTVRRASARYGPRVLTPAELLDVTRRAGATRGVAATLAVRGGQYTVTLTVASADFEGPWTRSRVASATDLPRVVDELLRSALPRPGRSEPEDPDPPEPADFLRWRVGLFTEAAFGVTKGFFYNHLGGVRIEHWFTPTVAFGASVAYVNLEGKSGRANNVLPAFQVEYRPRVSERLGIPLRYAAGFLPNNGPYMRASAGLGIDLTDDVDLVLDLVAPTYWFSDRLAVLSLDVNLELGIRF